MPGLLRSTVGDEQLDFGPDESVTAVIVPLHPLGVRPAGNAYTSRTNLKASTGLFSYLPDELLVALLEQLEPCDLVRLGSTCKALFAFSRHEELWKTIFISASPRSFKWHGTWYASYTGIPCTALAKISCKGLFSDTLHRPFHCAHTSLHLYTTNIPDRNRIAKMPNLSPEEFAMSWTDKPFILSQPVTSWPVYQDWSMQNLRERYGEVNFRAEAVDWPLHTYFDYMDQTSDECPLYLFDRSFVEKMQISVGRDGEYCIPECFGEDLFAAFGHKRPDSRWLIVGPTRSGSTFHKDPNATSAWNAVIRGLKYWIMFPTTQGFPPPPGVFVSEDQSEVTSPLSIAEWLLEFHAEARQTRGCMEGICEAGEVLHVPSGWWHLVVNLSPSIAITQNFVPQAHLVKVLSFLKDKPDQVSGFKRDIHDVYKHFTEKMEEQHPSILAVALQELKCMNEGRKRKWDELVKAHGEHNEDKIRSGGFSFGFGDADDSDIP